MAVVATAAVFVDVVANAAVVLSFCLYDCFPSFHSKSVFMIEIKACLLPVKICSLICPASLCLFVRAQSSRRQKGRGARSLVNSFSGNSVAIVQQKQSSMGGSRKVF